MSDAAFFNFIESDADQARRRQQEAADQLAREQRVTIAERAARPLTGGTGDLAQRQMFDKTSLFA